MKAVFASRNKNKIREFERILRESGSDIEILSLDDIGIDGEIEENGSSFEENSAIKASVPAAAGYIGIADDSGLEVDALGGAPGIYSARYAGEPCDNEKNNSKLLRQLDNIPDEKRTARFVSVICCVLPGEKKPFIVSRGTCEGIITKEARGSRGFGYDPLFLFPQLGKTFAELTDDEKNSVSHRGKAVREFCKLFAEAEKTNFKKEKRNI